MRKKSAVDYPAFAPSSLMARTSMEYEPSLRQPQALVFSTTSFAAPKAEHHEGHQIFA